MSIPMGENAFCHGTGDWGIGGRLSLFLSLFLFASLTGPYGKSLHSRKKVGQLDFET